jgi:hypothetical protein
MDPTTYEIRVAGTVPEEDLRDMGAVTVAPEQVNTLLYGVPDQAALYGLLDRLRALGVEVIEVRRVPAAGSAPDETDVLDEDEEPEEATGDERDE